MTYTETLARDNDHKAKELIIATDRHLANAETWATMAIYGPPEYKAARLEMANYELKMANRA